MNKSFASVLIFCFAASPAIVRSQPQTAPKQAIEERWRVAGYEAHMAELTVAALAPADLESYRKESEEEKLTYLATRFPFIFRYDVSESGRKLLVTNALPTSDQAAYSALREKDEQIAFCLKKFGEAGVVYSDQYRTWVRVEAAKALGEKPATDNSGYIAMIEKHVKIEDGIYFQNNEPTRLRAAALFAFSLIPGVNLSQLTKPKTVKLPPAKSRTALALLAVLTAEQTEGDAKLVEEFDQDLPTDAPSDKQIRQAGLLVRRAQVLLNGIVWPTPFTEYQLATPTAWAMGPSIVAPLDPAGAARWKSMSGKERTEELAKIYRMQLIQALEYLDVSSPRMQALMDDPTAWSRTSPEVAQRALRSAYPGLSFESLDEKSRKKLILALSAIEMTWSAIRMATDPLI